jgi:hypothetical protein
MASGDVMMDSSGNVILDASGNLQIDDGAGNTCCCGGGGGGGSCDSSCSNCLTGRSPATITVSITGSIMCTSCVPTSGGPTSSMKITAGTIDGTYTLTKTSACTYRATASAPTATYYNSDSTCTTAFSSTSTWTVEAVRSSGSWRIHIYATLGGALVNLFDGTISESDCLTAFSVATGATSCTFLSALGNAVLATGNTAAVTPNC